jgi:hypothetical protein
VSELPPARRARADLLRLRPQRHRGLGRRPGDREGHQPLAGAGPVRRYPVSLVKPSNGRGIPSTARAARSSVFAHDVPAEDRGSQGSPGSRRAGLGALTVGNQGDGSLSPVAGDRCSAVGLGHTRVSRRPQ